MGLLKFHTKINYYMSENIWREASVTFLNQKLGSDSYKATHVTQTQKEPQDPVSWSEVWIICKGFKMGENNT